MTLDDDRVLFLLRVAQIVPGVLADLRDRVWPEYCRVAPYLETSPYDGSWQPAPFPPSRWPESLDWAVTAWSQRHQLIDKNGRTPGWIRKQLDYTLAYWGAHPEAVENDRPLYWWGLGGYSGMQKVTPQTGRLRRNPKHFDWATLYQVGGEETADIAGSAHADVRTVNKAVTELLNEIGLVRRQPHQIGRPK
jgi:hypothetical protein